VSPELKPESLLSYAAQLGYAKTVLALLLRMIILQKSPMLGLFGCWIDNLMGCRLLFFMANS